MKRIIAGIVIGFMIGAASTVAAQTETVKATFSKFIFVVNGHEQQLNADPVVIDGMTYLPVRAVADLLGYAVKYDKDQRKIELVNPIKNYTGGENITSEWISLRDLANDPHVDTITAASIIIAGTELKTDFSLVYKSENLYYEFNTEFGPLRARMHENRTYINLSDFEKIKNSIVQ